jgi:hypothetical protein
VWIQLQDCQPDVLRSLLGLIASCATRPATVSAWKAERDSTHAAQTATAAAAACAHSSPSGKVVNNASSTKAICSSPP